jgi:hypothetical protein
LNWTIFAALEVLGEELQMFFEFQKQTNNVWDSTSFEFLNVHSVTYLPYSVQDWFLADIGFDIKLVQG